eukprot:2645502-Amphidinium_carterae.1
MDIGVVEEGYVPTEVVDGVDDGPRLSTPGQGSGDPVGASGLAVLPESLGTSNSDGVLGAGVLPEQPMVVSDVGEVPVVFLSTVVRGIYEILGEVPRQRALLMLLSH